MSDADFNEDALVEQPAIKLFSDLKWETPNCYYETFGPSGSLGRETPEEVVLVQRLRPVLEKLNPTLPSEAISLGIEEITRGRGAMSPAAANREVCRLLKDGVRGTYKNDEAEAARQLDVRDCHRPAGSGRADL